MSRELHQLQEAMRISDRLTELDPIRGYPLRGARELASAIDARAFMLTREGMRWSEGKPHPDDHCIEFSLRTAQSVYRMKLFCEFTPSRDERRMLKWASRLFSRGLDHCARFELRPVMENARGLDEWLRGTNLTPREREVASKIAIGRATGEIAEELGLTPMTVNTYLKRTYKKLGVRSRVELAARLNAQIRELQVPSA